MMKGHVEKLEAKSWNNKRHWDFCKCVKVIPHNWNNYYSSLNIERISCKENHHVNSLGLNGSTIHTVYLVELRKKWHDAMHMMQRWNAADQTKHMTKPGNPGRQLKLRSWGVTPTMELLTHGGEHHEIVDGGWLMMMTTTNPPLRSPERTPDQPSERD